MHFICESVLVLAKYSTSGQDQKYIHQIYFTSSNRWPPPVFFEGTVTMAASGIVALVAFFPPPSRPINGIFV